MTKAARFVRSCLYGKNRGKFAEKMREMSLDERIAVLEVLMGSGDSPVEDERIRRKLIGEHRIFKLLVPTITRRRSGG